MKPDEPISLRDHFAGQALAGLAAVKYKCPYDEHAPTWDDIARCAYGHADAMLRERGRLQREYEQARRT